MNTKNLYIKTFGCQMNERDSEIIARLLGQHGYVPVAETEGADLIIINTCSIREKAEQKVFSLLGYLRQEKQRNPALKIAVTGCVAQQEGENLCRRMEHVDLVVGTQQIYRIPELLARIDQGLSKQEVRTGLATDFTIPRYSTIYGETETTGSSPCPAPAASRPLKKFVNIMQGCNNYCSYCVVPMTRGREISRPVDDILEEINSLVDQGVREITLLGQNVNSYGKTNPVAEKPVDFADLLRTISAVKGLQRLRFTTSHPKDLSEKLMRCFAEIENLCPHFHLPVQSGSNRILARMNRKYTVESYLDKIALLRSFRPDIALATDIIVGFPGETDDDFRQTMDLLNAVRFNGSFSFKYSDRPGTRSSEFDDKVDEVVKSQRLQEFQARQDEISLERNREQLGAVLEVMAEDCGQIPHVQGRSPANHIVHFTSTDPLEKGAIVPVKIFHAGKHSLKGEVEVKD